MRAAARRAVGVLGGVALTVAACSGGGGGDGDGLTGPLPGAGSSAQENAMLGWIAGFQDRYPDVLISYDPVGSGSGREMFLNSAVLFAGSDAAMDAEELEQGEQRCHGGEVIELPLYIAPIAVAYHLPELGAEHINMTPEVIAEAFSGEITSWDDPAIAELNPDLELPATDIVPVNRSDDSGTTENFTDYLAQAAGEAWPHEASETWPISGTQSGTQNAGVVTTMEAATGTLGYLDASQVTDAMGTVAVGVGGEFVPFSPEAAAAVVDVSEPAEDASELRLTLDLARDTTESGVYPIVLVSYLMACSRYESPRDAENVAALLRYIAGEEAQQRAARPDVAGAAPISDRLRERVLSAVDEISATE